MALSESTIQDKIEIVGDYKHVQVRTATVISRDGVEISRAFSRHVVGPLMTSQVRVQKCKPYVLQFILMKLKLHTLSYWHSKHWGSRCQK
jgi:hypothetical protein